MHPSSAPDKSTLLTPIVFFLLLIFSSLAHVIADMYVPSMPAIVKALGSNAHAIQFTLSAYVFGFSLSHLFYGPISDRIGRRKPILAGIGLSVIGSLICWLAPSVTLLIIGRIFQGAGVGACNSAGRSLSRDLLSGTQLAKVGSHIGMISVFVMAAAPTLGGYIQDFFGWRATFLVLFAYTLTVWLLVYRFLPETNFHLNPDATKMRVMLNNYFSLLKHKAFIGYTICAGCAYAGLIAYFTSAPFLLQTIIGLTPVQFGWLAFLTSGAIFISAFINSRLVVELGIEKMVFVGNLLMLGGGIIMLILGLLNVMNATAIMFPVVLFAMGAGFTFSNAFAGAFHPFPKMAGTTGALYGCLQILGGAITSAFIASIPLNSQVTLAAILTALGLLSLLALKCLAAKET